MDFLSVRNAFQGTPLLLEAWHDATAEGTEHLHGLSFHHLAVCSPARQLKRVKYASQQAAKSHQIDLLITYVKKTSLKRLPTLHHKKKLKNA